jgi:copper(I)-binding protein
MTMHFLRFFAAAAALAASTLVHAQHYTAGDIHVFDAYARPTVSHQPTGGAYVGLENMGKTADRLVSASSPVAKRVEIHNMSMDGNVMKMKEVGEIELKPDTEIVMKPGNGYHLMLVGLNQRLKAGESFPMTLVFEKAGKVEVTVKVGNKQAKEGEPHHGHHH